jgi:RNA polymerase-associated protein LEO1
MSDSEDPIDPLDEIDEDGGDDLFGDEGDGEEASPKARILDDDDLASDPDGENYGRYRDYDDDQQHQEVKDRVVMAVQAYRHRVPKPSDGAVRFAFHLIILNEWNLIFSPVF